MNPQSANGFWLNDSFIEFNGNLNMTLLDFLRYSQNLRGTKIGCREGDCGACVVIQGKFSNGNIKYQQIVSCLTPMGNVIGTHILTIEGINLPNQLTLPQKSLMETGGTQCGFCTVGFIISLTAYCMNANEFNRENAIKAIDGNICRCTGYKSIIRAIDIINSKLQEIDLNHRLEQLVQANVIPISVIKVAKQMERISPPSTNSNASTVVGGGTDLFVMKRLEMLDKDARYILPLSMSEEKIIERDGNIVVHGSTTVTEFVESPLIQQTIPNIKKIAKREVKNLSGKLSLLQTAALMKEARMNYANDSAPAHLASAVNAPICEVFCSTVPEFGFTPLSTISHVVQINGKLDCRPCGMHGKAACPKGHFNCAQKIEVAEMLAVLDRPDP